MYICSMNYFELFGFPERPVADKTVVAKKYFELQKKFHPDFFTNENEAAKEEALEMSANINRGFQIFKNDDNTLEYFLIHRGVIIPGEKYNLDPEFLMEMMEQNEAFEGKDENVIRDEMDAIAAGFQKEIEPILAKDASSLSDSDMDILKACYYKKKYLKRILERLGD